MKRIFKYLMIIMALVAVCVAFVSCGGNSIFGGKSWDTIANVQKNIDGTVWTYTQPNDLWIKLEFKNGKCNVYTSNQSKGSWGVPKCENYVVKEYVEKQTSEKVVVVSIGTEYDYYFQKQMKMNYSYFYELDPKNEILYFMGAPLSVHPTDYKW